MKLISVLPGRRLSPHSITDAGLAGLILYLVFKRNDWL